MRPGLLRQALAGLFLAALAATPALADLGSVSVYAVCRVDTEDGRRLEGILPLTSAAGYAPADRHGLLGETAEGHRRPMFFDARQQVIELGPDRFRWSEGSRSRGSGPFARVYYLRDVTSRAIQGRTVDEELRRFGEGTRMSRRFVAAFEYDVLDYLPLYPELPETATIESSGGVPRQVKLDQVRRIELLRDPPPAWRERIATHRTRYLEETCGDDPTGDCQLPIAWYHDFPFGPNPPDPTTTRYPPHVLEAMFKETDPGSR